MKRSFAALLIAILCLHSEAQILPAAANPFRGSGVLPFLKHMEQGDTLFTPDGFFIEATGPGIANEAGFLEEALLERGLDTGPGGMAIRLKLGDPGLPVPPSVYEEEIRSQGYRLQITGEEVIMVSPGAAGLFYAVQTFLRMIGPGGQLPEADIVDWPDFPVRMIMVDPARQNERFSYYRRLIRFCGEYKINVVQVHLTDHQTSVLLHEDYPELMHLHAWTPSDIAGLVDYAARYHVRLVPEIESFGHSRMFTRLGDATDYLHQTEMMESEGWTIIDIPGYTSVLCPASEKALDYLGSMYERAGAFQSKLIHLGFDEVDLSECSRCNRKFGDPTGAELFRIHLDQCLELAGKHYREMGIWGDMLLQHPGIMEGLPPDRLTIFDWHYTPEVDPASLGLFTGAGFRVIACPALMCYPHILMPSEDNLRNVRNFISLAREYGVYGVNTTIWVPQRYLSDALWTGISYAASQSWGGSSWDERAFYASFMEDFFGSGEGARFHRAWDRLMKTLTGQDVFHAGCWHDREGVAAAVSMIDRRGEELKERLSEIRLIIPELAALGETVSRHQTEWETLQTCAEIQEFVLEHLLVAREVRKNEGWDTSLIRELDRTCSDLLEAIERDWDRNRYSDDPNKDGLYQENEHVLYKFRKMHAFHAQILNL